MAGAHRRDSALDLRVSPPDTPLDPSEEVGKVALCGVDPRGLPSTLSSPCLRMGVGYVSVFVCVRGRVCVRVSERECVREGERVCVRESESEGVRESLRYSTISSP